MLTFRNSPASKYQREVFRSNTPESLGGGVAITRSLETDLIWTETSACFKVSWAQKLEFMHASLCNQYDQTKGGVSDPAPVNSKRETQLRGPSEKTNGQISHGKCENKPGCKGDVVDAVEGFKGEKGNG